MKPTNDMVPTIDRILKRVRGKGQGSVWTPHDFLDLGSRAAVDQALSRLARRGSIRRLARGVYDYPRVSPRLGPLTPSSHTVAQALAKATGSQLQVTGAEAANLLGLSTQVPAKTVYLTDGPSRCVTVGREEVRLRHAPSTRLIGAGTKVGIVVQALRHLGPGGVDAKAARKIAAQLTDEDRGMLRRVIHRAPAWLRPVVDRILHA